MRVVVTGSRHWSDYPTIWNELAQLDPPVWLGHGGAKGADWMAARAAKHLGYDIQSYTVKTSIDGPWPAAGHRRNERMLDAHRPHLVIAFRAAGKSNGTDGCVEAARRRGIRVKVVEPS